MKIFPKNQLQCKIVICPLSLFQHFNHIENNMPYVKTYSNNVRMREREREEGVRARNREIERKKALFDVSYG